MVGWAERAGEGLRGDVLFSQLSYCICTALEEEREDIQADTMRSVSECKRAREKQHR